MRQKDEIISCPTCGKLQSKYAYESKCCWDCGSIRPLPTRNVFQPVDDVHYDVEEEEFDESTIKRLGQD